MQTNDDKIEKIKQCSIKIVNLITNEIGSDGLTNWQDTICLMRMIILVFSKMASKKHESFGVMVTFDMIVPALIQCWNNEDLHEILDNTIVSYKNDLQNNVAKRKSSDEAWNEYEEKSDAAK